MKQKLKKNENLITITNGIFRENNDGMGYVCFRFNSQDNAQGSKERTQTKNKREIVKVEVVSCMMCDSHL